MLRTQLMLLVAFGLVGLLQACGGSSDPSPPIAQTPNSAPSFTLIYPASNALTDATMTSVVGSVADAEGDEIVSVQFTSPVETVSGNLDASGQWRVDGLSIEPGPNAISVTLEDSAGSVQTQPLTTLVSQPVLSLPGDLLVTADGRTALVADLFPPKLISLDVASGLATELPVNIEDDLLTVVDLIELPDGTILVGGAFEVAALNLQTGTTTEFILLNSEFDPPPFDPPTTGTPIAALAGLALDPTTMQLFVALAEVDRIDVYDVNGEIPILLRSFTSSNALSLRQAIEFVPSINALLLLDENTQEVLQVDVETGVESTFLADDRFRAGITYDAQNDLLIAATQNGEIEFIDPATATVTNTINLADVDNSLSITQLGLSGVDPVVLTNTGELFQLTTSTNELDPLFSGRVGEGAPLFGLSGVTANLTENRLIAGSVFGLSGINLGTGDRSTLSTFEFPPDFTDQPFIASLLSPPTVLTANENRAFTVSNLGGGALFETDLISSESQLIVSTDSDATPSLSSVASLALDADETTLFMTTGPFAPQFLTLDIASGSLSPLVDVTGQVFLVGSRSLFFDAVENRLVFTSFLTPESVAAGNGLSISALNLDDLTIETLVEPSTDITLDAATAFFDDQGGLSSIASFSEIDGGVLAVFEIATGTVSRTALVDELGPQLQGLVTLTAGLPGQLYATSSFGFVFQIDMQTGARVIISR